MSQDYARKAQLLRAKAADPVVDDVERKALLRKAEELEKEYGKRIIIDPEPTITNRSGQSYSYWPKAQPFNEAEHARRTREAWDALWDLHRQQEQWNRPHTPDPADLVEDGWESDPDEDGWDGWEFDPDEDEDEDYGYEEYN